MLNIFASTFNTATRTAPRREKETHVHWQPGERFNTREKAELEAHLTARRRD
ncbi:MAG: hypothetical protein AB8B82_15570 [Roseovarius sp.]